MSYPTEGDPLLRASNEVGRQVVGAIAESLNTRPTWEQMEERISTVEKRLRRQRLLAALLMVVSVYAAIWFHQLFIAECVHPPETTATRAGLCDLAFPGAGGHK